MSTALIPMLAYDQNPMKIDPAYRHYPKTVTPLPPITLGAARLKFYTIAKDDTPVPSDIESIARDYLHTEVASPRWELADELGFVLLHRCGTEFYFLLLSTWRGSNELWETVYYKPHDAALGFAPFPQPTRHKGTYCVWEMAVVWHETQAWVRYLASPRGAEDTAEYLGSQMAGVA
jgi:hypothetical protein